MSLLLIVLLSVLFLAAGYRFYGAVLSRLFRLDPASSTPSIAQQDGIDYIPTDPKYLLGQHFSAIAAAGPIVGPILAGAMFGWLPALIWLLIGAVFIGGVHDFAALVASVRHKARSIAEVIGEHMSRRAYLLFLAFVWLAIVYIVVAFTDIVATSFVGVQELENGVKVSGGGIASSSMLYLALPIIMALLMKYAGLSLRWATIIFLPLIGVAIWAGQYIPLDLASIFSVTNAQAAKTWDVLLLLYCFVASIVPMWILLQPRGHLGGYFLFVALAGGLLGIIFGGKSIEYPAFTGFTTAKGDTLFPMLFITIACGACSGFHALVASGTTSKQLRSETDARPIAYGSMLLEALVAIVSLCCIMMLSPATVASHGGVKPNLIYGIGMSGFLQTVGIPVAYGICFALLAFTTFVYDTLDVSTRLGRYILQELTGLKGNVGRYAATAVTIGVPMLFVTRTTTDAAGNAIPAWRAFWNLFGASNQLLAALTLIGITVWLYKTYKAKWVWLVTGLPMAWMFIMSTWALAKLTMAGLTTPTGWKTPDAPTIVAIILLALAVLLFIEMLIVFSKMRSQSAPEPVSVQP
jgi:carbon starvation protein